MNFRAEENRLCAKYGVESIDEVLDKQEELLKEGVL